MNHSNLPRVMVAPNGARRTRRDHRALPMTVDQLITDALECQAAGATGLHVHTRDNNGAHVLDLEQYRDLSARMHAIAPQLYLQLTSESAGRYQPAQQIAFLAALPASAVSVAVREVMDEDQPDAMRALYCHSGHDIQHILYDLDDTTRLARAIDAGLVPGAGLKILIVHGRYGDAQTPPLSQLTQTLKVTRQLLGACDYAVCSFGMGETDILRSVLDKGGKIRAGFENNLINRDGSIATSNAARIREILGPPQN